jgi:hypothetical protein
LLCSPFCQPCTSLFSSIFPFCCSHLWPPTLSTIVVCYLGSYLTKKVVVSHYSYLGNQPRFFFVIVSKSHMVNAKPYLTSSLSNYWCKSACVTHQVYPILSALVAYNFFVSITTIGRVCQN